MISKNILHAAKCLNTIEEIERKIEVLKNVTSEDYKVNFNVEVFGIGDLIFVSEDVEPTVDLAKEAIYLITKKLQEELDALTIDYEELHNNNKRINNMTHKYISRAYHLFQEIKDTRQRIADVQYIASMHNVVFFTIKLESYHSFSGPQEAIEEMAASDDLAKVMMEKIVTDLKKKLTILNSQYNDCIGDLRLSTSKIEDELK